MYHAINPPTMRTAGIPTPRPIPRALEWFDEEGNFDGDDDGETVPVLEAAIVEDDVGEVVEVILVGTAAVMLK